jgi:hypothetical protein
MRQIVKIMGILRRAKGSGNFNHSGRTGQRGGSGIKNVVRGLKVAKK